MTTLQELLNLGLVDIGPEDSRLAKMEAAGTALVEHLRTNPALVIPAALLALDSDANENDPIFTLAEDRVIEHWKTMRNTHVNRPRELLRSLIIHALSVLADGAPEMAALIWQTTVSPLNHGQARFGKEVDVVRALLQASGRRSEEEAVRRFLVAVPAAARQPRRPAVDARNRFEVQPHAPLVDAEMIAAVGRAAGPQYPAGQAMENPNPHWSNSAQTWSYEFTPRMTTALVRAVNLGMERVLAPLRQSLQLYIVDLEQRLSDQLEGVEAISAGIEASQWPTLMRLDVLWWAEAKYSPSLMRGYRELQPVAAAVAMAHDLTLLVPPLAPASVVYLLGEAVAALSPTDATSETHPVANLLHELQANATNLRGLLPAVPTNGFRAPLLRLTVNAIGGAQFSAEDVRGMAGVDPAMQLSIQEFAMWTFRDIQARRIAEAIA